MTVHPATQNLDRFNFSGVQILIFDHDKAAAKLTTEILKMFGASDPCICPPSGPMAQN